MYFVTDSTPMISPVAVEVNFSVHLQCSAKKIFSKKQTGETTSKFFQKSFEFCEFVSLNFESWVVTRYSAGACGATESTCISWTSSVMFTVVPDSAVLRYISSVN